MIFMSSCWCSGVANSPGVTARKFKPSLRRPAVQAWRWRLESTISMPRRVPGMDLAFRSTSIAQSVSVFSDTIIMQSIRDCRALGALAWAKSRVATIEANVDGMPTSNTQGTCVAPRHTALTSGGMPSSESSCSKSGHDLISCTKKTLQVGARAASRMTSMASGNCRTPPVTTTTRKERLESFLGWTGTPHIPRLPIRARRWARIFPWSRRVAMNPRLADSRGRLVDRHNVGRSALSLPCSSWALELVRASGAGWSSPEIANSYTLWDTVPSRYSLSDLETVAPRARS
mmetsp:Transcript_93448/g.250295  ORF Transcript_93448/g.250295 Transcript_93448/m.250295 type:complete len:288 (-) Transcript_93448:789-1652(-)